MKYMTFIKLDERYRGTPIPQGLNDAMGDFVTEGFKNGWLIDTAGLKGTADGKRVRLSRGKLTVTDGPFTEAKEMIGGYAIIQANSTAEAMDIATKFMDLHRVHWPEFEGECEVRPFEDMEPPPAA